LSIISVQALTFY